jgi:hypothetical protein
VAGQRGEQTRHPRALTTGATPLVAPPQPAPRRKYTPIAPNIEPTVPYQINSISS